VYEALDNNEAHEFMDEVPVYSLIKKI